MTTDTMTPETMTTENATPKVAAPVTPKVAAPVTSKVGDTVRLRAVHGYMQHPFDLVEFDTDKEPKVVLDHWHLAQVEAGKLAVVTD